MSSRWFWTSDRSVLLTGDGADSSCKTTGMETGVGFGGDLYKGRTRVEAAEVHVTVHGVEDVWQRIVPGAFQTY